MSGLYVNCLLHFIDPILKLLLILCEKEEEERVALSSCQKFLSSKMLLQYLIHQTQHLISKLHSIAVIDSLEVFDIQQHQSSRNVRLLIQQPLYSILKVNQLHPLC